MTVAEQLNEAKALAALLAAYGHPEGRRRIAEALNGKMQDADRLPMVRYDLGEILDHPHLPESLRIRLRRFIAEG